MVSLEEKSQYQSRINESPKLSAFNDLLLGKTIITGNDPDQNETDQIYYGILEAIQKNSKSDFLINYEKKKKSNPYKESPPPFVNDDFLIFSVIVGILRFNEEKAWINNILSIRTKNAVTLTFQNILSGNYYSTDNLSEITLIYFRLNDVTSVKNDILNMAFISISENKALFENKNDFQIICSLRAYEVIIELKSSADGGEIDLLKKFNKIFLKRMKILAWIVSTAFFVLIFIVVFKIVSANPSLKSSIDKLGSVLKVFGIIGLSQIGNIIPGFKKFTYESMLKLFGYSNKLINYKENKEDEKA